MAEAARLVDDSVWPSRRCEERDTSASFGSPRHRSLLGRFGVTVSRASAGTESIGTILSATPSATATAAAKHVASATAGFDDAGGPRAIMVVGSPKVSTCS